MLEYQGLNDNESAHSLDSEFDGFDVPLLRSLGVKRSLTLADENLHRSIREKNLVSLFGYNDYMAYHYAFMMKVATVREPERLLEATKDPQWVKGMNEEIQELGKKNIWDLVPHLLHKKAICSRESTTKRDIFLTNSPFTLVGSVV